MAAAFDDDRFLFVGTTNIDYGQTWIWNMSLIAKDGNLALYRQVLLASASFPIVFPPVEIDGHLFVDGAARSNVVIAGLGGTDRPSRPPYGPGTIYLVDNGKLHSPPEALPRYTAMFVSAVNSARYASDFVPGNGRSTYVTSGSFVPHSQGTKKTSSPSSVVYRSSGLAIPWLKRPPHKSELLQATRGVP